MQKKYKLADLTINHLVKCYWGAFDSKTSRIMDNQEEALNLIKTIYPNAKTCYFPIECTYDLHTGYPEYKTLYTSTTRGESIYYGLLKLKLIEEQL